MSKYKVCGYDMEDLHAKQLIVAKEVDKICREHGWKCSLYGGSVIGAVRHNGFIPWDHDIDMCMPRADYEKFLKYMLNNPNDVIFFSNYKSETRYPNNWGKVRLNNTIFLEKELAHLPELHKGIFIDLHPIDNIVPAMLKIQVRLAVFWSCIHHQKNGRKTGVRWKDCVYGMFTWLPNSIINFMRDFTMKWFLLFPTRFVYKVAHPNNGIYPIKRETFEDLIEHQFEDYSFLIPRNYDEFLRDRYGDYLQLPPESEIYDCCTSIVECKL